jgi:hypothetical protein
MSPFHLVVGRLADVVQEASSAGEAAVEAEAARESAAREAAAGWIPDNRDVPGQAVTAAEPAADADAATDDPSAARKESA